MLSLIPRSSNRIHLILKKRLYSVLYFTQTLGSTHSPVWVWGSGLLWGDGLDCSWDRGRWEEWGQSSHLPKGWNHTPRRKHRSLAHVGPRTAPAWKWRRKHTCDNQNRGGNSFYSSAFHVELKKFYNCMSFGSNTVFISGTFNLLIYSHLFLVLSKILHFYSTSFIWQLKLLVTSEIVFSPMSVCFIVGLWAE